MRVRSLRGVGVYFVNKDEEVALLDLQVAGLAHVHPRGDYSHYFEQLYETLREVAPLSRGERLRRLVLRLRSSVRSRRAGPLVLALALMSGRRVICVALGSATHGVLFAVDERLRSAGWQRAFYVEVRPTKVHHAVR
uniref:Uncharacterized protein n=1 Tax=Thermofilum pendens TaxID=2269 RepID=A0A7C4F7Y4_THEPE